MKPDFSLALSAMQAAVDIVNTSPHPTNKIAATLFSDKFTISKTNYWPAIIESHFGTEQDIGNSSGTIHAEVSCILSAPLGNNCTDGGTNGASLCITDPFCPNCAKNIAEAGIKSIYIDHKGFDKDFAARRGDHFQNMSMQICERAGINVYEMRRREGIVAPILEIPADYRPTNDSPVVISSLPVADQANFLDLISDSRANMTGEKFAVALAHDAAGKVFGLCAKPHLAIGYSRRINMPELHDPHGKYTFILEPVNRLLMNAARLGLKIYPDFLYASIVPTARELVNVVGADITHLYLGDPSQGRDESALSALKQLSDSGILKTNRA